MLALAGLRFVSGRAMHMGTYRRRVGWIKALGHGGKQAFAERAEACHACGLCVTACPEQAIRLARR